jgi:hypothetical protein
MSMIVGALALTSIPSPQGGKAELPESEWYDWGISSAGRAPALQAGGRRFDPVILHQSSMPVLLRRTSKDVCGVVKQALAIEPVRVIRNQRLRYRLSFFNNQEEVVKRFTKGYLEMGIRVGESGL